MDLQTQLHLLAFTGGKQNQLISAKQTDAASVLSRGINKTKQGRTGQNRPELNRPELNKTENKRD